MPGRPRAVSGPSPLSPAASWWGASGPHAYCPGLPGLSKQGAGRGRGHVFMVAFAPTATAVREGTLLGEDTEGN